MSDAQPLIVQGRQNEAYWQAGEGSSRTRMLVPVDDPAICAILNHMVERLDMTFAALADPTRRAMLERLSGGERSIGELAAPHAMTFAGASKHVGMLVRAGLVERRKSGRTQLCRLKPAPLAEADAWLRRWESFWNERLDALGHVLTERHHDDH